MGRFASGGSTSLSANQIRERLAGTRLPVDPLDISKEGTLLQWPVELRERFCRNLRPAGVLIPLVDRAGEMSVLLTQRSADLSIHAGQICFPGGRMEPGDADIRDTALRETQEEIGIAPQWIEIAGYLDPSPTVSGYAVTPVVGLVAAGFSLSIDPTEVEFAFEVPLSFLLLEKNLQRTEREFEGHRVPMVEFHYDGHRIWGATAHFLIMLRRKLND